MHTSTRGPDRVCGVAMTAYAARVAAVDDNTLRDWHWGLCSLCFPWDVDQLLVLAWTALGKHVRLETEYCSENKTGKCSDR